VIPYGLYFDGIDDVDDEEHIGFRQETNSQYLTFSFDDLMNLATRDDTPLHPIDF